MAFISTHKYGEVTVRASGDDRVRIGIGDAYIGVEIEAAERLHMQLGEVLAQLRAANDEGSDAPAAEVAA